VRSGGGRAAAIGGLTAAATLLVIALPVAASGSGQAPRKPQLVRFATSGDNSEIRERVPIAQHKWDKKRVAMTIGPGKLPTLHRGDILRTTAEVQVSTTCIDFNAVRCIGGHYRFSPREDARLVISTRRQGTGGRDAQTIAQTDSVRCHQPLPNRNHHCVLVFPPKATKVRPGRLPCQLDACHLNLVLEADHPRARDGQVIVVGADAPNGSVRQDKGRLNAIILRRHVAPQIITTSKRRARSIPIAPSGKSGRRVVYSQRIDQLHKGYVLQATAGHLMTISSLRYPAFIGTTVVLTGSPHAVVPTGIARGAATAHGVTEQNGFNCTHGPSQYRNPCRTSKAGAVMIRRDIERHGHPVPLYVNVVCAGKAKGATPRPGDHLHVKRRGGLVVRRFRSG
jgi:hypothetical protein